MNPIYNQAAAIPFRRNNSTIEILLITSINSGKWIFPKGIIDEGQTALQTAVNEAFEEAGIKGRVMDILVGEYKYKKWGGTCQVRVYPMSVEDQLDEWPEAGLRKRCWVRPEKAMKLIQKKALRIMLTRFLKIQQNGIIIDNPPT